MIITCPACAARYDVDDDRFHPDGRSVRCAECAESWFVPAPTPVENLMPLKPRARKLDEPRDEPASRRDGRVRFNDAYEEDVEEPLFSAGGPTSGRAEEDARPAARGAETVRDVARAAEAGREPRRRAGARGEPGAPRRNDRRLDGGADDEDAIPARARRAAKVVDADFEDLDDEPQRREAAPLGRGFGRKLSGDHDERIDRDDRRETALARYEDLEPIAERVFNEEFFTALRVQPKELERAIRKARRRAEARDKNRLTPMRALGWSAFVGAIAAAGFVTYSYRNDIVAMFPNALGAYQAIGIEARPFGLEIEGVTHRVAMAPEGPAIEILGRLRNAGDASVAAPVLQAEAVGADGKILSRWTFSAQSGDVGPGETVAFSTRAPAPDGVSEVLLSFAPAEGVKISVGNAMRPSSPQ
ncbi:MAG: zinc-ribbon domain-containing protein [Parvularculaceae bacterium]